MSKIPIQKALKDINEGNIAFAYYLLGKEKFFQDQILASLTQKVFPERASKDLNLTILYGSENTLSELISACLSYPMLAERKLVIVRDFDKMKISDPEALQKYLDNPQKSTCLVLSASEKGRAKIYEHIAKTVQTIDCAPIPEYKVGDWISNHCRQLGRNIEPQAIQFLIALLGSSLLGLDQEIKKIIDFKNDDSPITIEDLEQTTGISKEANVFALQNALARRQLESSLKIVSRLLDSGSDVSMINAVLFAFFRKILQVQSLNAKGMNRKEIGDQMRLREFQLKEIFAASSVYNSTQIKQIIGLLHQVDIAAKTSAARPEASLQMLCYKICRI